MNILKCKECGKYGLSDNCECGGTRTTVRPAKYSPEDKYASYRRKYKEQQ